MNPQHPIPDAPESGESQIDEESVLRAEIEAEADYEDGLHPVCTLPAPSKDGLCPKKRVLFVEDVCKPGEADRRLWATILKVAPEAVEFVHLRTLPSFSDLKGIHGFDWDNQVEGGTVIAWMEFLIKTNQDGYFAYMENKTHLVHSASIFSSGRMRGLFAEIGIKDVRFIGLMERHSLEWAPYEAESPEEPEILVKIRDTAEFKEVCPVCGAGEGEPCSEPERNRPGFGRELGDMAHAGRLA